MEKKREQIGHHKYSKGLNTCPNKAWTDIKRPVIFLIFRIFRMLTLVTLGLVIGLATAGPYEGGRGKGWSGVEKTAVNQQLRFIFKNPKEAAQRYFALHPEAFYASEAFTRETTPNAPKVLRLGFHDCLPYEDGAEDGEHANGCDGCLNSEGMMFDMKSIVNGAYSVPQNYMTNNNGLAFTADMLEEIYTNPNFPEELDGQTMPESLKATGKSRADLWAFATLAAVDYGIEQQNLACDQEADHVCGHIRQHNETCKFQAPKLLWKSARFGRRDCTPDPSLNRPFFTSRKEIHPSINFVGPELMKFFKDNFGLTAEASIALYGGAHSFGRFHDQVSLLKYQWTRYQENILNNQQFVKISLRNEYWFQDCRWHGDPDGNPAKTFWTVRNGKLMEGGGPYQFFHNYVMCARYTADCSEVYTGVAETGKGGRCCNGIPEGKKCLPEEPGPDSCVTKSDNHQEANILADAGLYWKFQVDPASGAPYGCPEMERARWRKGIERYAWPLCEKEDHAPEGRPMFDIVDEYADDQDSWVAAFYTAIERMLSNGYKFHSMNIGK